MKRTILPSDSSTSFRTAFSRSSNSPRYFAPATIEARSSETTRLPLRLSGTSPATMRRASPSTIAVLPTPGSPIRTGSVSYTHLRAHETRHDLVCRLLLEKKKKKKKKNKSNKLICNIKKKRYKRKKKK